MRRFNKLYFIVLFLSATACRISENSTESSQVVNIEEKNEEKQKFLSLNFLAKAFLLRMCNESFKTS